MLKEYISGSKCLDDSNKYTCVSVYMKINFATTWKDMAPVNLFQFGELKAAIYAF